MTRSLFSLNKSLSILLVISLIASVFTVVAAQPAYGAEQQLDSEAAPAEAGQSEGETPPGEDGGEGEQPLPDSDEESQGNDSEGQTEPEPDQPPGESDPFDELTPLIPLAEPLAAPGAGWKLVFEDFEDITDLRATGAQANANVLTQASRPEPVKYGSKSAKLEYDFLGMSGTSAAYIRFRNTLGADGRDIPGAPAKIGFWIYGEDKAHWIRGQVQGDGQAGVTIDFNAAASVINGWKYVTADIPPTVASPMKLNFIYVVETGTKSSGKIYVDELSVLYENTDLFALEWANVAPMTVGETRAGRVLATRKNDAEPQSAIGGLTYSSSDENVATVDGNGIITAHHAGETELTAVYNERYPAVYRLVVSANETVPDEVQIEGPASMVLTETGLLKAYAVFNGAEPVDVSDQTIFTAEPGNPVAHVSGRTIQAAAVGHIEITATYRGVSRSYTLEAKAGELKTIEIRGVFSAIVGGEPVTAKVFGDYKVEGYKEIPSGATFSSDNPAIASIDPVTGVIVGAAPGTTSIAATYEGQLAKQMIVVTNPVSYPKEELRGAWISTVENIDWPNATDFDPEKQRADYIRLLDRLKETGINAVFTQIRPTSDSFYPSEYFPWSHWLTGEQGKPPSDGYDPLGFMIEEAHKRNIEFHAWINPYRISMHAEPSRLASNHPARLNPDWVVSNGGKLYFNPGIPEAKNYIIAGVKELVEKYDVDGIHMDDYFYPYPGAEEFNDAREYDAYRNGGGTMNLADWRRNNVNDIVRQLHEGIKGLKPYVKFGISPFGIWRNKGTDPTGSETTGQQNYDGLYADTRTWIKQGWVDYIAPQIYWHFGYSAAAYEKLIDWWTKEINGQNDNSGKHDVHLYIGQAPYRVGVDANWTNPDQLPAQLRFNRDRGADVSGSIMFSSSHLLANPLGVRDAVASMYSRPALIPDMPWMTGVELPEAPEIAGLKLVQGGRQIGWKDVGDEKPAYYAVYRIQGTGTPDPSDSAHLLATVRRTEDGLQLYTDNTAVEGQAYTYAVSAVNRLHRESGLSAMISEPSVRVEAIELGSLTGMKVPGTQQIQVFALTSMGDREEIDSGVVFSSSNERIATVGSTGLIKALAAGTAVITAEYEGHSASYTLTVQAADAPGGSGSGGPSGGTPATPPIVSKDARVVTGDELEKAVGGKLSLAAGEGKTQVQLPGDAGDLLGEQGLLNIEFDGAAVSVPASLLREAAKLAANAAGKDLTIAIEARSLADGDAAKLLQSSQRLAGAALSGNRIVEVRIFAATKDGGITELERFAEPLTLTLELPEGARPVRVGVYRLADNGAPVYAGGRLTDDGRIVAEIDRSGRYGAIAYDKQFPDIRANHWAGEAIKDMAALHVITGLPDGTFSPDRGVTRGELVALLVRLLRLPAGEGAAFADVKADDWYADEVAAAVKAGIVRGSGSGNFNPNAAVTREEMAVMLVNAYRAAGGGSGAASAPTPQFGDGGEISAWAAESIDAAVRAGLLRGSGNNKFNPGKPTTRAESAQLMVNLLEALKK